MDICGQIIRQLTEDGNGSLSSSDEACSSHGLTRETLANSAEYYRRKRNNFTDAWENAVSNRQGIGNSICQRDSEHSLSILLCRFHFMADIERLGLSLRKIKWELGDI